MSSLGSVSGDEQPGLRSDARRNQRLLLEAATVAVLRDGPRVPMAVIAAEAGVGVATLYRRFPTRAALLDALTVRSFERVLDQALAAEQDASTGLRAVEAYLTGSIALSGQLVLPLHGGPAVTSAAAQAVQAQVHQTVRRMLDRGAEDGSIGTDVTARDIIMFGATLAQPLTARSSWLPIARRLQTIFCAGLARG